MLNSFELTTLVWTQVAQIASSGIDVFFTLSTYARMVLHTIKFRVY